MFHVGDVVMIINTDRYAGIPFEITERRFRDPREHEVIEEDFRMRRTQWYYLLKTVHEVPGWDGELGYRHKTVHDGDIEAFSWKKVDSKWEV
jgi:hypothetical protein